MKDLIVSLVLLGGTLGIFSTLRLMEDPRAATFPRVILLIMGILSGLLLIQALLTRGRRPGEKGKPFPFLRCLVCFGLIVVYFFFMEDVGFYVSAFLFFVAMTFVLGLQSLTVRTAVVRVAVAVVFVGILYVLFYHLLSVQTPKGLLF